MAFLAKQRTTCSKCSEAIEIGHSIGWNRRPDLTGNSVFHADCSKPFPPASVSPAPIAVQNKIAENNARIAELEAKQKALEATAKPAPKVAQSEPQTLKEGGLAAILAKELQPYLSAQIDDLEAKIDARILEVSKGMTVNKTLTVTSAQGTHTVSGQQHHKFPQLLKMMAKKQNILLFGEAGSGKSTAGIEAAKALGMAHAYVSLTAQSPVSWIMGFVDGHSKYHESEFYRVYKNGGVFVLDEIDAADANLLTAINSALANGKCAFPCGNVDKHPDFFCLATANTAGMGASPIYVGRKPLDGATRDRFAFLEWNTDTDLEMARSLAINPSAEKWVKWVQGVRKYAKAHYPKLLVSMRASIGGADFLDVFSPREVADMYVFKGLDVDSVKTILAANPLS